MQPRRLEPKQDKHQQRSAETDRKGGVEKGNHPAVVNLGWGMGLENGSLRAVDISYIDFTVVTFDEENQIGHS